jgi:hypothetical protein
MIGAPNPNMSTEKNSDQKSTASDRKTPDRDIRAMPTIMERFDPTRSINSPMGTDRGMYTRCTVPRIIPICE